MTGVEANLCIDGGEAVTGLDDDEIAQHIRVVWIVLAQGGNGFLHQGSQFWIGNIGGLKRITNYLHLLASNVGCWRGYTLQQSIGAALDGLPAGKSNQARKVNGDLFERLIRLLIVSLNVDCVSGTMQVPVKDVDGTELFKSSYQHDLLLSKDDELKIIGSVKTSSKDRIDKVFMDKFLYNRLTDTALPHIAIFLNDVQRKKAKRENEYGISATFLPGHFKAYTVKLNPLDGVYYCDIRPNMVSDALLSQHIKTIDHFFYSDLWELLDRQGQTLEEVAIKEEIEDDDAE